MSRNPRSVGGTRTQQLRHAKTSAVLRDYEQKEELLTRHQADPFKVRKKYIRPDPKKVDFSKPTMTKAMLAKIKQVEKRKEEYERKQESLAPGRVPKRTPVPVGVRPSYPSTSKRSMSPRAPRSPVQMLSRKTTELAKMMNADIVQTNPIGEGIIHNIVIPPGLVSDDRTTIVNIPQPTVDTDSRSQVANRSIQVISETLDEQDAAESAAVQNRLSELQQARRDFVIAVANVGGNALHLEDETSLSLLPESPPISPLYQAPSRHLNEIQLYLIMISHRVPELHDEYLQPIYGSDHPDLIAAREHMQKIKADIAEREAARRMEEDFRRIAAAEHMSDDLHLDIPFEEEIFQERDISWEEDESGMAMPLPSRIKAHLPPIPKQEKPYQYEPFDPAQLEKFFDIQTHPPCPQCRPPPGREDLHPDLWELDDPWFKPPPEPDEPDLIQFD
ncbi:PREDICTED: uncharacterized protein LOC108545595 [Eufriesea mexicana]|uniref:uncharacterized protein LOC108545595 n=1 Tax=Eufriesea mexicana TaxID=516756 RepID=UPI00083C1E0E|nr:PREDICTED: uncharacterized protein LOC108545595 [Eufriesea mexicana]